MDISKKTMQKVIVRSASEEGGKYYPPVSLENVCMKYKC